MSRIANGAIRLALAALMTAGCSMAHDGPAGPAKGCGGQVDCGTSAPKPKVDKQTLNAQLRSALFADRRWLIDVIADPQARRSVCIPQPNDSYELFQASVREDLEVLWDLDANSSAYRLSTAQRESVLECARLLEEYDENVDAWEGLMKESTRP